MKTAYQVDEQNRIIGGPIFCTNQEMEDDYSSKEGYAVANVCISNPYMDSFGNPFYVVTGGTVMAADRGDILDQTKKKRLLDLRESYRMALLNLPQSEDKAKTLFLEWIEQGSIGSVPAYWVAWKTARDTIEACYQECKSKINASTDEYTVINVDVEL